MNVTLDRAATSVAAITAALFFGCLFLGWHETTIQVGSAVILEETVSGWSGWGFAAGACATLLFFIAVNELRAGEPRARNALAFSVIRLGLLVSAVLAAVTGSADIDLAAGSTRIAVETTLWPAWVGVGLATVAAAASGASVIAEMRLIMPSRAGS